MDDIEAAAGAEGVQGLKLAMESEGGRYAGLADLVEDQEWARWARAWATGDLVAAGT